MLDLGRIVCRSAGDLFHKGERHKGGGYVSGFAITV